MASAAEHNTDQSQNKPNRTGQGRSSQSLLARRWGWVDVGAGSNEGQGFSQDILDYNSGNLNTCIRRAVPSSRDFQLIGQFGPCNTEICWYQHLEAVALNSRCKRAEQAQFRSLVVRQWREHKRWPADRMLMPRLRIEIDPDDVSAVGHVIARYHNSLPTDGPVSISVCRSSSVIPASSSSSEYLLRATGDTVNTPSRTVMSTSELHSMLISSAWAFGIRIARRLPHFCTLVFIVSPMAASIYNEYTTDI